jgi:hypothetical protein
MKTPPEKRASSLLARDLCNRFGPEFMIGAEPYRLRWYDQEIHKFCLRIPSEGKTLPPGIENWLEERGWSIRPAKNAFRIWPAATVTLPDFCYHATPSINMPSIQGRGLLTGSAASVITSGWPDAPNDICVSFTLKYAEDWTDERLLGKDKQGMEWTILSIRKEGTSGIAIRDGASQTGYLLVDKQVRWDYLSVAKNLSK